MVTRSLRIIQGVVYLLVSTCIAYLLASQFIDDVTGLLLRTDIPLGKMLAAGSWAVAGIMLLGFAINLLYLFIIIVLFSWCFHAAKSGWELLRFSSEEEYYHTYMQSLVEGVRKGLRHPVQYIKNRQFFIYSVVFLLATGSVKFYHFYLYGGPIHELKTLQDCNLCPQMVVIPAGEFTMGASVSGWKESDRALPQRRVVIPKAFAVGKYEVTWGQYKQCLKEEFCSYIPKYYPKPDDFPVSHLGYADSLKYIAWLSKKTGQDYRLPSEAEWEYFARAGTEANYYWGNEYRAGYATNRVLLTRDPRSPNRHPKITTAGAYKPNRFGLYDIAGSAAEWTQDCWHDNYEKAPLTSVAWLDTDGGDCDRRVVRGGHANSTIQKQSLWVRTRIQVSNVPPGNPRVMRYANDGTPIDFDRIWKFGLRVVRDL